MTKLYRLFIFVGLFSLLSASVEAKSIPTNTDAKLQRCALTHHKVLSPAADNVQATIDSDLLVYQSLVEQALIYRTVTIKVYQKIAEQLDSDLPLSGADLDELNQGMAAHLALRQQIYGAAYSYGCWLDTDSKSQGAVKLQGLMLSLSAALVLYDNYLLAISVFEENPKLRRYLNETHRGFNISRHQLTEITLQYNSIANRARVRTAITYFKKQWPKQSASFKQSNDYLYQLISQSPSYNSTLKFSPLYVINRFHQFYSGFSADTLQKTAADGINLFSLAFGNSVGLIQSRRGHLHKKEAVNADIKQQLKSGDILLEKTPFRLTDKLIPGYWGHVAIWLGSETELKQLGIWEHPVVKNFHSDIRAGLGVIEALRGGVQISSLAHFLNVDDVAVLRQKELSDAERRNIIVRALRQVGKAYDFNFDIETNDKIVCSELIYVAYTKVPWATEKTLGRHTISPTNIALKANEGGIFSVISLYLNGKKVEDRQQQFANLL